MGLSWQLGDRIGPLTKSPVSKVQLVRYAGASDDYNPIHTDAEFARSVGLDGVIAHGMLTMAFVGQMLGDALPPEGQLRRLGVRFMDMVRPGDEVVCEGTVTGVKTKQGVLWVDCDVWAEVAADRRRVVVGTALFSVPMITD